MMKIAMLAMNGGSGGLIRYIQGLLEIPAKHEINVFCTERLLELTDAAKWAPNVIVTATKYARETGKEILINKPLQPELIRMVEAYNPDVVFFSNGWIRRGLEKYPNVMVLHNQLYIDNTAFIQTLSWKNILSLSGFRYIVRRSMRKADGVIFLSEKSMQDTKKVRVRFQNGKTIYFGLSEKNFRETPKEHVEKEVYNLLYVSTFWSYKNHERLLDALSILKQEGFKFKMRFVGAGPRHREAKVADYARKRGVSDDVVLCGNMPYDAVLEEIDSADVFVYPSAVESTGLGVMEAMARGACVACSNKSCMHEVLKDAGVYFKPDNYYEIVMALKRLLTNCDVRTALSMRAHTYAKEHTWCDTALETYDYFTRFI